MISQMRHLVFWYWLNWTLKVWFLVPLFRTKNTYHDTAVLQSAVLQCECRDVLYARQVNYKDVHVFINNSTCQHMEVLEGLVFSVNTGMSVMNVKWPMKMFMYVRITKRKSIWRSSKLWCSVKCKHVTFNIFGFNYILLNCGCPLCLLKFLFVVLNTQV